MYVCMYVYINMNVDLIWLIKVRSHLGKIEKKQETVKRKISLLHECLLVLYKYKPFFERHTKSIYVYIYIYVCVCVCVCVWELSQ